MTMNQVSSTIIRLLNDITVFKRNNYIQTIKKELIGTAPLSRVSSEIFSKKDSSLKISQRIKKKSFSWYNHQQRNNSYIC